MNVTLTTIARWETSRPPRRLALRQLERVARTEGMDAIAATMRAAIQRELNRDELTIEQEVWTDALLDILENRNIPEVEKIWSEVYPKILRGVSIISRKAPKSGAQANAITLAGWAVQYEEASGAKNDAKKKTR